MGDAIETKDEAVLAAQYLLQNRGYVVLQVEPWGELRIGEIVANIWRIDVGQPFRVIAKTNNRDFEEQRELVAPYLGRPYNPIPHEGQKYYRAVTE